MNVGDIVIKAPTNVNRKRLPRRMSKRLSQNKSKANNTIQIDDVALGTTFLDSDSDSDDNEQFVDSREHLVSNHRESLSEISDSENAARKNSNDNESLLSSSSRESSSDEIYSNRNSKIAHNLRSSDFDLVITGEFHSKPQTKTTKRKRKTKRITSGNPRLNSSAVKSQSRPFVHKNGDDNDSKSTKNGGGKKYTSDPKLVKPKLRKEVVPVKVPETAHKLRKANPRRNTRTKRKNLEISAGKRVVKRRSTRKSLPKSKHAVEIIDLSDDSSNGIEKHDADNLEVNKKASSPFDKKVESDEISAFKSQMELSLDDKYAQTVYDGSKRRVKDIYSSKVTKAKSSVPKKRGRKKKGELVGIKYRRMPANKSKIITVDVIGQILSDYFRKRSIQKIEILEKKHEKRLLKFVSSLRTCLNGYFDSLIDAQLSNDMLISEIDSYQRQKVQSRLGIFATREERKQNSTRLNNLRHDYAFLRRKYELRKEMCNSLIRLKGGDYMDGSSNKNEAESIIGAVNFELSSVEESATDGVDIIQKLRIVNSQILQLLDEIERHVQ